MANREKEPLGVKIAELSKKIDVIQMGIGGLVLFVNPALGLGIIAFSAGTYVLAGEYQRRRRSKQQVAVGA